MGLNPRLHTKAEKISGLRIILDFGKIKNMTTITIPKRMAQKDDLVVLPRKEYEALIEFKKIKEFAPTVAQKRALVRAELNLKKGKTLSYNELVRKLGFTN